MYFDNAATTIKKPKELKEKYIEIFENSNYGNPSRGGHNKSVNAMMAVYETKKALSKLFNTKPEDIAFADNCSFASNFVIKSLVNENDHVITSTTEHNSILRPLYQSKAELSFVDFNENLELEYDKLESLVKENTRFLVINHASNLLANVNDLKRLHDFSKKHNLIMITDIAQTAGNTPIDVSKYDNSIFLFTGHKSLYGPTGTGGIIKNGNFNFKPVFSGGSGIKSFLKTHPDEFPTVFEIGTSNFISEIAFKGSIDFILNTGVENINKKNKELTKRFYDGIKDNENIKIYSKKPEGDYSSIVSLNIKDIPSSDVSNILDEEFDIQTRPGAHCAPLIHKHFKTEEQGIVRFSFSYSNEISEIDKAVSILNELTKKA